MMIKLSSKLALLVGILILILDFISAFTRPLRLSGVVRSSFNLRRVLMSDTDTGNVDNQFSGRGAGRFSSAGDRGGRGRGRGRPSTRDAAINNADMKSKEMIYDPSTESEVIRLYSAEDRVSLTDLSNGQKLRGRIVSVKE